MACSSCTDGSDQLVRLHPCDLIHHLIPPFFQKVATSLYGSSCDPEKKETLFLQLVHPNLKQIRVCQAGVIKVHMDGPAWICNDKSKIIPQNAEVKFRDVAIDPLSGQFRPRGRRNGLAPGKV
ncbi:hypothetical protein OGATHE_006732 [Ogataea polymorpha]|uniref:Uncharacterized protein n=1 Tax=Ogataea polymorpha TaxID=460523 RepID=A0A9P8NTM7_9ASCO|nr:hypothetical protein OGATHE_006732 [Ogataea polymorpha]